MLVDAGAPSDRQCFRQRRADFEQNHIVEKLHHLPATDGAAVRDLAAHALQVRPDVREQLRRGAYHDAQCALLRGFPRAGDGRVGIGNPGGPASTRDLPGKPHGRRAAVDHGGGAAPGTRDDCAADLLHLIAARQRQKDQVRALRDLAHVIAR